MWCAKITLILAESVYKVYTFHMTTKIQKWGNSLGVHIPKSIARELSIREGSTVSFVVKGDALLLRPSIKPKYTLKELLKKFDSKTLHDTVEWGADVGEEKITW